MASPEQERVTRFGLVSEEVAKGVGGEIRSDEVRVKVYGKPEDVTWCTEAREAQTQANHRHPFTAKPVPEMGDLVDRVARARDEGQVPFSIEAPNESFDGFLNRAGLGDIEFIPPLPAAQ